jgi:hypothetical protein
MKTAEPTSRSYYIEQFNDEVLPCEPSLGGWAEWLSKPDPAYGRDAPAGDGERFKATVMQWGEDVMAVREGGEWRLFNTANASGLFDGDTPTLIAARFGKGLGWSPENILDGSRGDDAIRDWLSEAGDMADDTEYFAVGFTRPDTTLIYHGAVGDFPAYMTDEALC